MSKTDVVVYAQGSSPQWGTGPAAPTSVTSIAKDAAATISFIPPTNLGTGGAITHYIVTPYIGASAQTPTTVALASTTTITGSNTSVYRQANVTGLTNDTAYTFTVKARNSAGDSVESTATGANTPMAGLIFGDDFNGPASGPIDPEHWLLDVNSTADESDYYRPDHVYLDGSGHLVLKADAVSSYAGKPYTTGCIQNNTQSYFPSTNGWTITFETRAQVCGGLNDGMWPAPWLAGTDYLQQFKTDQNMSGWDNNGKAEIDYAEWFQTGPTQFLVNTWVGGTPEQNTVNAGVDVSLAQHIYRVDYKPNASCKYYFDGSLKFTHTGSKPIGPMFHMWFQQIRSGTSPALPQYTYIDYLRIFDRNLG